MLWVKLRYLRSWNEKRRTLAATYSTLFSGEKNVVTPYKNPECSHVYYVYVIQVPNRDRVIKGLHKRGIDGGVHYPVPLHHQPAYTSLEGFDYSLPITEKIADQILSLPLYQEMKEANIQMIVDSVVDELRTGI